MPLEDKQIEEIISAIIYCHRAKTGGVLPLNPKDARWETFKDALRALTGNPPTISDIMGAIQPWNSQGLALNGDQVQGYLSAVCGFSVAQKTTFEVKLVQNGPRDIFTQQEDAVINSLKAYCISKHIEVDGFDWDFLRDPISSRPFTPTSVRAAIRAVADRLPGSLKNNADDACQALGLNEDRDELLQIEQKQGEWHIIPLKVTPKPTTVAAASATATTAGTGGGGAVPPGMTDAQIRLVFAAMAQQARNHGIEDSNKWDPAIVEWDNLKAHLQAQPFTGAGIKAALSGWGGAGGATGAPATFTGKLAKDYLNLDSLPLNADAGAIANHLQQKARPSTPSPASKPPSTTATASATATTTAPTAGTGGGGAAPKMNDDQIQLVFAAIIQQAKNHQIAKANTWDPKITRWKNLEGLLREQPFTQVGIQTALRNWKGVGTKKHEVIISEQKAMTYLDLNSLSPDVNEQTIADHLRQKAKPQPPSSVVVETSAQAGLAVQSAAGSPLSQTGSTGQSATTESASTVATPPPLGESGRGEEKQAATTSAMQSPEDLEKSQLPRQRASRPLTVRGVGTFKLEQLESALRNSKQSQASLPSREQQKALLVAKVKSVRSMMQETSTEAGLHLGIQQNIFPTKEVSFKPEAETVAYIMDFQSISQDVPGCHVIFFVKDAVYQGRKYPANHCLIEGPSGQEWPADLKTAVLMKRDAILETVKIMKVSEYTRIDVTAQDLYDEKLQVLTGSTDKVPASVVAYMATRLAGLTPVNSENQDVRLSDVLKGQQLSQGAKDYLTEWMKFVATQDPALRAGAGASQTELQDLGTELDSLGKAQTPRPR